MMIVTWHVRFVSIKLNGITRVGDRLVSSSIVPPDSSDSSKAILNGEPHEFEGESQSTARSKAKSSVERELVPQRSAQDLEKLVTARVKKLLGTNLQPQNTLDQD